MTPSGQGDAVSALALLLGNLSAADKAKLVALFTLDQKPKG